MCDTIGSSIDLEQDVLCQLVIKHHDFTTDTVPSTQNVENKEK